LNLPFIEGDYRDNIKLRIASEGSSGADERADSSWTATIELQPPGLGAFNARIVWNGTQIDACLWSDREETRNSMSQAAETLRVRLEQVGLATGSLTVLDRPPSSPSAAADTHTPPLLDLRV
jgi:flagellar hook-length control protein FliK